MLLDSGILELYKLVNTAPNGQMPNEQLVYVDSAYYGERTVGYNRQYAAKAVNESVDKLIRIWRDESISAGMYVLLEDGDQYQIDFVQHLLDDDGLKVTDLTLKRLEKNYELNIQT